MTSMISTDVIGVDFVIFGSITSSFPQIVITILNRLFRVFIALVFLLNVQKSKSRKLFDLRSKI